MGPAPTSGATAHPGWVLHEDRALPAEPGLRSLARQIYGASRDLPVVSMHGHVEPERLARDVPFDDPAAVFVTPDHYLVRLLASQSSSPRGVPGVRGVADLGVPDVDGDLAAPSGREIWRRFCAGWPLLRGTPTRYWLEHALVEILGAPVRPSAESANLLWDHLVERFARADHRPRALFDRFGIEVLATTDEPSSSLAEHAHLAADGWGERVVPTFRPDVLLRLDHPRWRDELDATPRPQASR